MCNIGRPPDGTRDDKENRDSSSAMLSSAQYSTTRVSARSTQLGGSALALSTSAMPGKTAALRISTEDPLRRSGTRRSQDRSAEREQGALQVRHSFEEVCCPYPSVSLLQQMLCLASCHALRRAAMLPATKEIEGMWPDKDWYGVWW